MSDSTETQQLFYLSHDKKRKIITQHLSNNDISYWVVLFYRVFQLRRYHVIDVKIKTKFVANVQHENILYESQAPSDITKIGRLSFNRMQKNTCGYNNRHYLLYSIKISPPLNFRLQGANAFKYELFYDDTALYSVVLKS